MKDNENVKVSVIIPNYNNEEYLQDAIECVLAQSLKEVEVIVIDDCSTDNSLEKLNQIQSQYPNKVKVIQNEVNMGAGMSRNVGINIARGEYIKFLDADDTLDRDVLEEMYNAAKEHNVKIVVGQTKVIRDEAEYIPEKKEKIKNELIDLTEEKEELVYGGVGIGDELFAKELFDDIKFPQLKWEDFATIPAIKALAKQIYHIDKVVYNYRVHGASTTSTDIVKKNPKIFDIVKGMNKLRSEIPKEFSDELDAMEYIHYHARMKEIVSWENCPEEYKKILISSFDKIIKLDIPDFEKNPYLKKPEKVLVSEYIDKDILEKQENTEDILYRMEEYCDNPHIFRIVNQYREAFLEEIDETPQEELIKMSLNFNKQLLEDKGYSYDDKKDIISCVYKILNQNIPGLKDKIKKINKNGHNIDDRYEGLGASVESYIDSNLVKPNTVEEILSEVEKILKSPEFLSNNKNFQERNDDDSFKGFSTNSIGKRTVNKGIITKDTAQSRTTTDVREYEQSRQQKENDV